MGAARGAFVLPTLRLGRRPRLSDLPWPAWAWLAVMTALTLAAAVVAAARAGPATQGWWTLLVLGAAANVATAIKVHLPSGNVRYSLHGPTAAAAALLLPFELVVLFGLAVLPVEATTSGVSAWYKRLFNVGHSTLSTLAGWAAVRIVTDIAGISDPNARLVLAGIVAVVACESAGNLLLALMLRLAHERPLVASIGSRETIAWGFCVGLAGVSIAIAWKTNPWLVAPLTLSLWGLVRALRMPLVRHETRLESKTRLYNARYFTVALEEEIVHARRSGRPLALLLADLDHLREINNTQGHLAGDAVLTGVADLLRGEVRDRDVAARFGGEEFAVLLPDVPLERARAVAERIRAAAAGATFRVAGRSEPVRATISIGVAVFPEDGADGAGLIEAADQMLYRAKAAGRNHVAAPER